MVDIRIRYRHLISVSFVALQKLGGTATNEQILNQVVLEKRIPKELALQAHSDNTTELDYQLRWCRTHLEYCKIIERIDRALWRVTDAFKCVKQIDNEKVYHAYKKKDAVREPDFYILEYDEGEDEMVAVSESCDLNLRELQSLGSKKLHWLFSKILEKSGFINIAAKDGDNNISIYSANVSVKDFFMINVNIFLKAGNPKVSETDIKFARQYSDKGQNIVFATTGKFLKSAEMESVADSERRIWLMDGNMLLEKIKEYELVYKPAETVLNLSETTINKLINGKRIQNFVYDLLEKSGESFSEYRSYARRQNKRDEFWVNPSIEVLKNNWNFVLNDWKDRKLIIFYIPKNTFELMKPHCGGLFARNDKPNEIAMTIQVGSNIELNSRLDLSPFLVKTIKY